MPKNTPNTTSNCLHCGKEFKYYLAPKYKDNSSEFQKYCSYECSTHKIIPSKKIKKSCATCGKDIFVTPAGYDRKKCCSKKCLYQYYSGLPKERYGYYKACKICGKKFYVATVAAERRICCSRACDAKNRSTHPDQIWTEIECKRCKKKLMRRTYRIINPAESFCSIQCRNLYSKEISYIYNHKLNCVICGKEFSRTRFFVDVRKDAKCCSRLCLDKYNSINKRREKNVNWTGGTEHDYGPNWHEQQRAARKRDGWHCQLCGLEQQKHIRLDVHHIVKFKSFEYKHGVNDNYLQANQLTNLITLCRKCHRRVEKKPILLSHILA